jgi:predicted transcriptional regulator
MSERKSNRGKIEIMADILSLSTSGIKKTHIMYRANLSYEQILYYLNELLSKALMVQDVNETHTTYRTTEKGREFLNCFARLCELAREDEQSDSRIALVAT